MNISRSIGAVGIVAVLLSACSGGGAATQQPAGATQSSGTGSESQVPPATDGGGGGGGGAPDFSSGKAHIEVRGAASDRTVDLGFLPIASHFGGQDSTILNYVPGANAPTETLTVTTSSGTVVVTYASLDLTVSGVECTASNTNFGASSASGTVECSKTIAVKGTGMVDGVTIKTTFDAHG